MSPDQRPPWDDGPAALETFFTQAIAEDPANARLYFERARVRRDRGDLDGARADYDAALQRAPDMAWAYYERGLLRESRGDLAGAAADLRRALDNRVRASGWQFSLALGRVAAALGETAAAVAALHDALSVQPDHAEARALLARLEGDPTP